MRKLIVITLAVLLVSVGAAFADSVGTLTTFTPNTPAHAESVNDNFTAITTAVDDNAADITTNADSIASNAAVISSNANSIDDLQTTTVGNSGTLTDHETRVITLEGYPHSQIPALATSLNNHASDFSAHHSRVGEVEVDAWTSDNGYLISETDPFLSTHASDPESHHFRITETDVDTWTSNNGYLTIETDPNLSSHAGSPSEHHTRVNESEVDAWVGNNGYLTTESDPGLSSHAGSTSVHHLRVNETDVDTWVSDNGYLTTETDPNLPGHASSASVHHSRVNEPEVDGWVSDNGFLTSETDPNLPSHAGSTSVHHSRVTEVEVDSWVANDGYLTAETDPNLPSHAGSASVHHSRVTESEVDTWVANDGYLTTESDPNLPSHAGSASIHHTRVSETEVDTWVSDNGYLTDLTHSHTEYPEKASAETISGAWNVSGSLSGNVDADTLDGSDSTDFAAASHTHSSTDVTGPINATTLSGFDATTIYGLIDAICNLNRAGNGILPGGLDSYCRQIVFVSSGTYMGNFNNAVPYDEICQNLAEGAGLPGIFQAWTGAGVYSPSNEFFQSPYPYVKIDGTVIANDWDDLTDGSILNPINMDENGATVSASAVWTGTQINGVSYNNQCLDWRETNPIYTGIIGNTSQVDANWTDTGGLDVCNTSNRIYCFQQ